MRKSKTSNRKFDPALTAREHLINCSYELEDDSRMSWPDRVTGFILLDHALEYVRDPMAYQHRRERESDASFFGEWKRPVIRGKSHVQN